MKGGFNKMIDKENTKIGNSVKIVKKSIGCSTDIPIEKFLAAWGFENGIGVIDKITGDPWNKPGDKDAVYVNGFAFSPADLELLQRED